MDTEQFELCVYLSFSVRVCSMAFHIHVFYVFPPRSLPKQFPRAVTLPSELSASAWYDSSSIVQQRATYMFTIHVEDWASWLSFSSLHTVVVQDECMRLPGHITPTQQRGQATIKTKE